ncbi:putative magnesium chelatase ATPase subunit I [Streptomyces sp. Tu6071]|uniref:AAA family ATPase n=1 Tax=Streptomyces sp. Tu6071 TaxID=355249 RepID=UPI00020E5B6F|nr:AAA family ATPase [Streptomyces sp. Tu6071]EGJ74758.1 putative magnesium chelatase ATPase subunit I [Streptomyces sp. Tu6071]
MPAPQPPAPRDPGPEILPYGLVVGQEAAKRALELQYVEPAIRGVLLSGQRGTAKSTVVRAFGLMTEGLLPVTLPINATDDRVLGGWELDALLRSRASKQPGLLAEAGERGLLYIDEVNLLDDHIVNLILDAAATGVLSVQREGRNDVSAVSFALCGTMNPEEGGLRPQLLDRFGLLVPVAELDAAERQAMVRTVLRFDTERAVERAGGTSPWLAEARAADAERRAALGRARAALPHIDVPEELLSLCAQAASRLEVYGHRGDLTAIRAARALAALEGAITTSPAHLRAVLPMAFRHRRPDTTQEGGHRWTPAEEAVLDELLGTTGA